MSTRSHQSRCVQHSIATGITTVNGVTLSGQRYVIEVVGDNSLAWARVLRNNRYTQNHQRQGVVGL